VRAIGLSAALILSLICAPAASPTAGTDDGFEEIFDGKSLNGWSGKSQFWSIRDGAITGQTTDQNPTDSNTFLIFRNNVADFELRWKVKISSGNSGVQYRSIEMNDFVVHGYQADIDPTERYLGDKVEIGEDGNNVVVGKTNDPQKIARAVRWGDWNDYRVTAMGNRFVQEINGLQTVDVIDKENGKARAEGVLALQLHAGPPMLVQFKEIQLKRLK
jgi:hypothetical protein